MPRWFARLFRRKNAPVVRRMPPGESEYGVDAWRTLPALVKKAQGVITNPDFQLMMGALKNQHLTVFQADGFPSLEVRAVIQAQSEGYMMALNDLVALGVYEEPKKELREEYAPEEILDQPTEKEQ